MLSQSPRAAAVCPTCIHTRCGSSGPSGLHMPPASLPLPPPTADDQGSQAYAKALAKAGVLTQDEANTIVEGLSKCVASRKGMATASS